MSLYKNADKTENTVLSAFFILPLTKGILGTIRKE